MSSAGHDHYIGEFHFTDNHGFDRYWGRTCNLYGSAEDAYNAGLAYRRQRSTAPIYVWRTGLFDYTMTADAGSRLPELFGAVLVPIGGIRNAD